MERIAVEPGLTLAAVLQQVASGKWVVLTHRGADFAVVVRPGDLNDAALAQTLEALDRVDLQALVAQILAPEGAETDDPKP